MPSPNMMDAFKNLIRHGKNHHHASKPVSDQDPSSKPVPTQPTPEQQQRAEERRQARERERQQQQEKNKQEKQPAATQKDFSREAELIVEEEKESKAKMPVYKGLERFKLLDKMGDGAFSNVYKALDLTTGKKVAVKVVRKFELNASQRANILKEVQIMRGTNHPAIVKLISFSESDEHYFLVLELMEGGELFHQIVKLTYFSEALSRHVILQVAQGIRYLHEERGVVHRDIKPENLLFDRIPIIPSKTPVMRQYDEEKEDEGEFIPGVGGGGIGRVKIADFGLSKVVWNEETMTPCGTVGYTAPEIVKDERYSKSVDMWALGCVLYTLLCGFPPFYDESINVLTEKVARGYYTFLSPWWDDISHSAKDLITHLLCVDPAQRYTIDEFLAHPWCSESPAPPPPPTPLPVPANNAPLDSPLLQAVRGGGRDGRSPGLATLKEAFDVTYAVHRMEEEGARRRVPGGTGQRGFLQGLNEEDESEEEDVVVVQEARKKHGERAGTAIAQEQRRVRDSQAEHGSSNDRASRTSAGQRDLSEGRAGPRDLGHGRKKVGGGFELDLDGATLLGRRHRRGGNKPLESSPLARNAFQGDTIIAPQSPMRGIET